MRKGRDKRVFASKRREYMLDPLILFYTDLTRATEELPVLAKIPRDEKKIIIDRYLALLSKKDVKRVEQLRDAYKAKLNSVRQGKTVYHKALGDQYQRILNILNHHLFNRSIT